MGSRGSSSSSGFVFLSNREINSQNCWNKTAWVVLLSARATAKGEAEVAGPHLALPLTWPHLSGCELHDMCVCVCVLHVLG